jgi:hypothetical protein
MDYSNEWEDAWSEHVANWEPLEDAHEYIHSSEWKEDYFRTHEELTELGNPYPPNLHTMCIESFSADDDGKFYFIPILRETMERVYCDVANRRMQAKKKKASETDGVGADTDAPVDEFEYIYDVELRLDMDDDDSWVQVVDYTSDEHVCLFLIRIGPAIFLGPAGSIELFEVTKISRLFGETQREFATRLLAFTKSPLIVLRCTPAIAATYRSLLVGYGKSGNFSRVTFVIPAAIPFMRVSVL